MGAIFYRNTDKGSNQLGGMRKKYPTYEKIVEAYLKKPTKDGFILGIGSGRTSRNLLNSCISICKGKKNITYTGISTETELALHDCNVPTVALQTVEEIDLYFDGVDHVDSNGWMIKGYGGAIFLESIAMQMAAHCVIVAPSSKCVSSFANMYVPVEIVKPSLAFMKRHLEEKKCTYELRHSKEEVYTTHLGNIILDVMYQEDLISVLDVSGVVAHGLIPPSEKTEIVIVEDPLY